MKSLICGAVTCGPAKELALSREKPIPYQPPLPPNEAPSGIDAAAGVTPVGLRPPFVTPAAAHSHPDCRGIPILIVAPQPAPARKHTTTWAAFIRVHLAVLAGTDFFTVEVLTLRGLVTYYVLF